MTWSKKSETQTHMLTKQLAWQLDGSTAVLQPGTLPNTVQLPAACINAP
jgi:hypothetical protein